MLISDHMNYFTVPQLVQNQSVIHTQKTELKVLQWFLIMSITIDSTSYMFLNCNTLGKSNKGLLCSLCLPYRANKPRVHIFIGGFLESEASLEPHTQCHLYVSSSREHFVSFHQISKKICYTKLNISWLTYTKLLWVASNDFMSPSCTAAGFIRLLHVHSINPSPSSPYDRAQLPPCQSFSL